MHAGPSNARALTLSPAGSALNEDAPASPGDVTVCWPKPSFPTGSLATVSAHSLLSSLPAPGNSPPPRPAAGSFLFSFAQHLIRLGITCVIQVSVPSIVQ